MICSNCNTSNDNNSNFCMGCGKPLLDSSTLTPPLNVSKESKFTNKNIIITSMVVAISITVFLILWLSSSSNLDENVELKIVIDEKDSSQIITMIDENGKFNKLSQQFSKQSKIEELGMVEQDGMKFVYFKATDKKWMVDYFWDSEVDILFFRAEDINSAPKKISYSKNIVVGEPIWKLTKGLDEYFSKIKTQLENNFKKQRNVDHVRSEVKLSGSNIFAIVYSSGFTEKEDLIGIFEVSKDLNGLPQQLNVFQYVNDCPFMVSIKSIEFRDLTSLGEKEMILTVGATMGNYAEITLLNIYTNALSPGKEQMVFSEEIENNYHTGGVMPDVIGSFDKSIDFLGKMGEYRIEVNGRETEGKYNPLEDESNLFSEKKHSSVWVWSPEKEIFVETNKKIENIPIKKESQYKVILYSQTNCGSCYNLRKQLNMAGIKFKEYFIDKNSVAENVMREKIVESGFTLNRVMLPVVEVNGKMLLNYPSINTIRTYLRQ